MADTVYYHLERMLPELDDLEKRGLFSKAEIKEIVRRRRDFEFRLGRRSRLKEDFLRYVEYEKQVEALRKLRKKALTRELSASKRRWQHSLCDRASAMRIMLIYERAVTRFKGDLDLWLQYLEYCRSQGTRRMQKVLMKALQLHPNVPGLWIYAAAWEVEHNLNVTAARALMQRGLRMCRQSENLWLEYFRMELFYAQKLKALKKISSVESAASTELEIETNEEKEHLKAGVNGSKDELIHLNGNDMAQSEKITKRNLPEDELCYKLARAIFHNAISAIPLNSMFRRQFIETLDMFEFEQAIVLEDEILNSLKKDFPMDESCWDWQAKRKSERAQKHDKLSVSDGRQRAIQVYEDALSIVPTTCMFEAYAMFLEDLLDFDCCRSETDSEISETDAGEPKIAFDLLHLYQRAAEIGVMSSALVEGHVSLLLRWGKLEEANELVKKLLGGNFKFSPMLWAVRISLEMKRQPGGNADLRFIADLFQQASKLPLEVSDSKSIWNMVMEYLAGEDAFNDVWLPILESALPGCNNKQIGSELACSFIDWILHNRSIEQARATYKRLLALPGPSVELYKHCINIESRIRAAGCTEAIHHVRTLFKSAVEIYGQDGGLWLEYCSQEMKAGNLKEASAVHWRARKTLRDPSYFIESYQHLNL